MVSKVLYDTVQVFQCSTASISRRRWSC